MRRTLTLVILLAVAAAAGWAWWHSHQAAAGGDLAIYGNVDLREVELAFNDSERIIAVLVQEGDRVKPGDVLARLDTSRLKPQADQAAAMAEAQRQVVRRLHNGSRPEEIAEARAMVDSSKADLANAQQHYNRLTDLSGMSKGAVSEDELLAAKSAMDAAKAKLVMNERALDLSVMGPRQEDIDQAEAQLRADEAQAALLKQELVDATLVAPSNAVVRSRLMEPGDMATPQKPVFSLAVTDPKWVRAYVTEPDLGKVHPGMTASIVVDSFPNRRFEGWVGFVSPVAEFTPKTVQTDELRTSLVYEVRAFVKDPADELRLGMPATVFLPLSQPDSSESAASTPTPNVPPPSNQPAESSATSSAATASKSTAGASGTRAEGETKR